jgi:hypothetical protein
MRQIARLVVAVGAVGIALACEAFIDELHDPPLCCMTPCPLSARDALFVAPNGATSGTCGSAETPCGSIGAALALVDGGAVVVAIAAGNYRETVDLHNLGDTVVLCGGYDPGTWVRGDASTSIVGTDSVAIDDHPSGPTCLVLDGLDIATKAQAAPGETLVGVYAFRRLDAGSYQLCARGTNVSAAPGGNGQDGDAGASGVAVACPGDAGADGAAGIDGDAGVIAISGSFDGTGQFIPGDGHPGTRGSDGLAGTYSPTTCSECSWCQLCVPSGNKVCNENYFVIPDASLCSAGLSGCGGGGGAGGGGGGGGGASAAMVVGMNVFMSNARLTAQTGGHGGLGAHGGAGANGTSGTNGFCTKCGDQNAGTSADSTDAAGTHDDGGAGGHGGAGSNGAGGWSCAIVVDDVAGNSLDGGVVLIFGEAGVGDPNGQAAAVCHTTP